MSSDPIIRLRAVYKAFREGSARREVLSGVDLDIAPGERLALLGQSGSGKSTLLNLIGGLEAPDGGLIEVLGQPLHSLEERARTLFRRSRLGFVYQFFNLIPTLTVAENVRLPLELNGTPLDEAIARARTMLDSVGLLERAESFPDRLSGGEQQRVAIARALVHRPAIVLADEPTGNLDAASGRQAMALLDALVERDGATLVVVTHSRSVADHADRVLTLKAGRLEASIGEAAW